MDTDFKKDSIEEAIKNLNSQQHFLTSEEIESMTIKPVKSPLEALDKLDHTLCLNILECSLKFSLDKYHDGPNDTPIDCANVYEMIECIDIIRKALIEASKRTPAPHYPITDPYITYGNKNINNAIDWCENCPNKYGLRDGLGNPTFGDSPCQWCTHNPRKVE